MKGVGSLRNLTGGSGRKPSSSKQRRRNSSAGEDDDFIEPTIDFTSNIKKTPIGSLKKSKSAPQTPTDPKQDLRNFFRSMSAPAKSSQHGKEESSADLSIKTPSKIKMAPAQAILSPPKPKALQSLFDDAIVILDSNSDAETPTAISVRSTVVAEKENFPSTLTTDDSNDCDISIIATTPTIPRAKRRTALSSVHAISITEDAPDAVSPDMSSGKRRPSYYLKNFFLILDTVMKKDAHLILPNELTFLNKIQSASEDAQRLFVRLVYRRGPWFQVSKLVYHEISDIAAAVNELITAEVAAEAPSPADVLHLLSTPQLKNLLKGSKSQSSLSSPTAQTPREALLDQARKWISNQRTLFGKPVMPKELGRCIRIVESIDIIVKRIHRLFFMSQTEDQSALTLVHLGRVAFPTYLLQGVEVDDGLNGAPFPVVSVVPEAFKNPYAMLLLEQKTQEQSQNPESNQIAEGESRTEPLPLIQSEDVALFSSDSLGIPETNEQDAPQLNQASGQDSSNGTAPHGLRPRWLIEANLTILNRIGFCSVFPDRETLEEYESAMKIAVEVANLLGEDLDGTGAAGTTGELTGSMSSTLTAGFGNGGPKWGRASRLSEQQIASILSWVDLSIERVQKYPKFATKTVDYEGGRTQVFDYEKNLFLRRFTAKWIYASVAWIGVSLLERQRNYVKAVEVLRALLDTDDVCLGKRGEWWLRMGFDLAHLNDLQAAIDAIVSGIKDPHIRPQQRLGLYSKLRILLRASQRKESAKEIAEEYDDVEPLVEVADKADAQIEIFDDDDDFMLPGQSRSPSNSTPKSTKKRKRRSSVGAPAPKRRKSDIASESKEISLPPGVDDFVIKEPVTRVIQARPLMRGSALGPSFGKSLFIGFESDTEVGVEELALQFYRLKEKFAQGSHCEGGPLGLLFGLLMWDIMFDASVPHVFQTPVQDAPLDFGTEDFYNARKAAIEERLSLLEGQTTTNEESSILSDMIEQSFNKWHGRVCRVVNWTRWTIQELKDIANCIGGKGLAGIFRRFAMDFRYSHSGLPDLLLWDPASGRAKFVEVKGPRDRLSDKQRIWIDYMMNAGIDVEVLYVREKLREGEVDESQDLVVEKEPDPPTQLSPADPNATAIPPMDNDAMVLD